MNRREQKTFKEVKEAFDRHLSTIAIKKRLKRLALLRPRMRDVFNAEQMMPRVKTHQCPLMAGRATNPNPQVREEVEACDCSRARSLYFGNSFRCQGLEVCPVRAIIWPEHIGAMLEDQALSQKGA